MNEFLSKYQKVPVDEFPNRIINNPIVSVCVQTYQQVNYIKQCLDGILMQETNFTFEILLGEDQSTDGTRQICIEYAEKYPDKIRLFLHRRENNIKRNGQPSGFFNFFYNLLKTRGNYISLCEGDDYWTDRLKLQKQVDFLKNNPEYGLIHSDCNIINSNNVVINHKINKKFTNNRNIQDKEILIKELLDNKTILRTASVVFRSELIKKGLLDNNFVTLSNKFNRGDIVLWMNLAKITRFAYIDEPMINYRITNSSVSRPGTLKERLLFMLKGFEFRLFFLKENNINDKALLLNIKRKHDDMLIKYRLFTPEADTLFEVDKKQSFINRGFIFLSKYYITRFLVKKLYTFYISIKHYKI